MLDESSGKGKAAGHKVKLTAALVLAGTSTEGLSKPGRWVRAMIGDAGCSLHRALGRFWGCIICPALCGPPRALQALGDSAASVAAAGAALPWTLPISCRASLPRLEGCKITVVSALHTALSGMRHGDGAPAPLAALCVWSDAVSVGNHGRSKLDLRRLYCHSLRAHSSVTQWRRTGCCSAWLPAFCWC